MATSSTSSPQHLPQKTHGNPSARHTDASMILPSRYLHSDIPAEQVVFRRRDGVVTFAQYHRDVQALCTAMQAKGIRTAVPVTEDNYHFAVALMASLHAGADLILPSNRSTSTCDFLQAEGAVLLADTPTAGSVLIIDGERVAGSAPLPEFDPAKACVSFFTSGSTGTPKRIVRRFANIEAELQLLEEAIPEGCPTEVFSTVSFHHAYGIIFGLLLPLSRGQVTDTATFAGPIDFLQRIAQLTTPEHRTWVVTTPAFIRVWATNAEHTPKLHDSLMIQSAGSPLPMQAARHLAELIDADFFEIFGSSETGVVGYRSPLITNEWTPFRSVTIQQETEGGLSIYSPCTPMGQAVHTGDSAEFLANGNFILKPRTDSIVKIADKRISLIEIEENLRQSPLVDMASVLQIEGKSRPILAAAVTPTELGREVLLTQGKQEYRKRIKQQLSAHLPAVLQPKRWRVLGELPCDRQGKTRKDVILNLFATGDYLPVLTPVFKSPDKLVVKALFEPDALWVPGHFPKYALVPGVIILRSISAVVERYWGRKVQAIKRLKFSEEVRPSSEIYITAEKKGNRLSVVLSFDEDACHTSGKGNFSLRETAEHPSFSL